MKKLFTTFLLCSAAILVQANTYYVSSSGNDASNGKSISEAWKTIAAVNNSTLLPGDNVLFQGGATFTGSIIIVGIEGVTFNSYGNGKATISSGESVGIWLGNSGKIIIKNLVIKGAGYMATSMRTDGIGFYIYPEAIKNYNDMVIDNVEVYGYGGAGVSFYPDSPDFGYKGIRITNSLFHDNGMSGLQISGYWDESKVKFSNSDVYIGNCKAYFNHGRKDYQSNWSGSGILVAGTERGLVEYCEAYENGKDNNSSHGNGPIGIWMDNSKYVTIQDCISHHNRGGLVKADGGGFDIDGGCYGGVIQNCVSYENEGCGYGLFQWQTGNPWSKDTIRNNTSTNDARNTKYGAITFWGASSVYKVTNAEIYGNQVSMDKAGQMLTFIGNNYENIQIHDNTFCIAPPAVFYKTLSTKVTLTNNSFPCLVLSVRTGSFKVKRIS